MSCLLPKERQQLIKILENIGINDPLAYIDDEISFEENLFHHAGLKIDEGVLTEVSIRELKKKHYLNSFTSSFYKNGSSIKTIIPKELFSFSKITFCIIKQKENEITWLRLIPKE